MPDIVSDATRIYEPPIEARNQVYLDQTNPGAGAAFGAGVEGNQITLPFKGAAARGELEGATPFQRGVAAMTATGGAIEATPFTMTPSGPAPGYAPPIQSPTISAEEANEQYAPRDLDGKIIPFTDKPLPQALAQLIGKEKTEAIQRESTLARFAATHSGLTTFAVNSIASQVGDPLSLGLFFVPPVGEAAILARVGEGFLGRTVARLGAGAVTGAGIGVVGAGIRGGIGALDPEAATDYSMRDALSDVLYSAAGFAVLHAGFGAGADVLRGLGVLRPLPPREGAIAPAREPALPAVDAVTQNAVMRTAAAQLADGRPVDVDSFFYRPPQADTAVGLALRPVGRAEIVAAPDVEAQARRIAPEAFARYDPLVQRANEIRAQIADPEATFGREIDQQIAELRARAEAARSAQAAPVGATPEEVRAGIAQQTAAYEAAVREADVLAAQRAALVAARSAAARSELGAVDAQLRDIAQTGEMARARAQAENILSARAAGRATVMGPRTPLPELPGSPREPEARVAPSPVESGIANDVARELITAGRPEAEANAAAAIVQAFHETRAARLGITPRESFDEANVRIAAGRKRGLERITEFGTVGVTEWYGDAETIVRLFASAKSSTFLHEMGHVWLEQLVNDAADSRANAALRADMETIQKWLGLTTDDAGIVEAIPSRAHERFARGFEQYLAEGRSPSPALAAVFENFKKWLNNIFDFINLRMDPRAIGPGINDDVRGVFDRLLAPPESEGGIAGDRQQAAAGRSNAIDMALRQHTLAREGWAPGMSQSELAAATEAVYGKRPEAERAAAAPAPRAAPAAPGGEPGALAASPEEAMLEQQIAHLPPEALHPEDRAMIDEATAAVTEATTTYRSALETAASCIIGLVG